MQWDKTLNAGFSSAPEKELYIPIDKDENRPDVMSQMNNKNSLWHFVRHLLELRKSNPDLQNTSSFELLVKGGKGEPLVYKRGQTWVAINPTEKEFVIKRGKGLEASTAIGVSTG